MEKNTPKQLAPVNGTPFDYLRWRGDLTFARDGFNEVDNLVLCILSYINSVSYTHLTLPTIA